MGNVGRERSTDGIFDAREDLYTASRALLVLPLHVEYLEFFHNVPPLCFRIWDDCEIGNRSRARPSIYQLRRNGGEIV